MGHDKTTLTLFTGESVDAVIWSQGTQASDEQLRSPAVLLSSQAEANHWNAFAEKLSKDRTVYALWGLTGHQLLQTIWHIGEPSIVISQGAVSGDAALHAAYIARGTASSLMLIDYSISEDSFAPAEEIASPTLLIRGRQSDISSHTEIVAARQMLHSRPRLVELENCGDRAAESCPEQFIATVRWFLDSEKQNQ